MVMDQLATLKLEDVLSSFRNRLQKNAATLDVTEKSCITRLLVKEIAVGDGTITIRHSIPVGRGPIPTGDPLRKDRTSPPCLDPGGDMLCVHCAL